MKIKFYNQKYKYMLDLSTNSNNYFFNKLSIFNAKATNENFGKHVFGDYPIIDNF